MTAVVAVDLVAFEGTEPSASAAEAAPGPLRSTGASPVIEPEIPKGDFSNRPTPDSAQGEGRDGVEGASGSKSGLVEGASKVRELTTATREVFENPDGSRTLRVSSVPTRFQEADGSWRDIDLSLTEAPDGGLRATASPLPVTLLTDPSVGLAQWDSPAGPVVFSTPGLTVGGVTRQRASERLAGEPDRTVDWPARPGSSASARVALTVTGFDQEVVLADASVASYVLRVSAPKGWSARQTPSGVDLVDGAGAVVSQIFNGTAFDASGKLTELGKSTPVSVGIESMDAAGVSLRVSVDPKWLSDPARVFPVVIDPQVDVASGGSTGHDTYVDYFSSTLHGSDTALNIGLWNSLSLTRAYLKFDLSSIAVGQTTMLQSARLDINEIASTNGQTLGHPMNIWGIGQDWSDAITWGTAPVNDGKGIRAQYDWWGDNGYGGAGLMQLPVDRLVSSWIHDGQPRVCQKFCVSGRDGHQ